MTPILLLTRPAAASARFLAELEAEAGTPIPAVISPAMQIIPVPGVWRGDPVSAVILTSENGADAAGKMGLAPGLTAYCVGDRTADAARRAGLTPLSADGDAESLIALILSRNEQGPLLHLRGEHARGDIAARLGDAGVRCDECIVYRQTEAALSNEARKLLMGPVPVIMPLFSPRTVTILLDQGPFSAPLHIIAISPTVAATAKALAPVTLVCAESPDSPAMVKATLSCQRALRKVPLA